MTLIRDTLFYATVMSVLLVLLTGCASPARPMHTDVPGGWWNWNQDGVWRANVR